MIASDRISAFDVILPKPIPYKGQVLNQIAAYMLNATEIFALTGCWMYRRLMFLSVKSANLLKLKW
jgi:phosphoribosylaminoimidazole-succinocarboxamide synthase